MGCAICVYFLIAGLATEVGGVVLCWGQGDGWEYIIASGIVG